MKEHHLQLNLSKITGYSSKTVRWGCSYHRRLPKFWYKSWSSLALTTAMHCWRAFKYVQDSTNTNENPLLIDLMLVLNSSPLNWFRWWQAPSILTLFWLCYLSLQGCSIERHLAMPKLHTKQSSLFSFLVLQWWNKLPSATRTGASLATCNSFLKTNGAFSSYSFSLHMH